MVLRKVLIAALFFMALGALSLHLRIHPIFIEQKAVQVAEQVTTPGTSKEEAHSSFSGKHFLASLFCFIDLVLVTWFFCYKKTAAYAFMLNGMIAIFGTILMSHFTIAHLWGTGASLADWIYLKSTLADIIILLADFLIGKAVYDSYRIM
jgi:hypothetical protein